MFCDLRGSIGISQDAGRFSSFWGRSGRLLHLGSLWERWWLGLGGFLFRQRGVIGGIRNRLRSDQAGCQIGRKDPVQR